MNLTGNDLKQLGFIEGKALGLALDLVEKQYSDLSFDDKLAACAQEALEQMAPLLASPR